MSLEDRLSFADTEGSSWSVKQKFLFLKEFLELSQTKNNDSGKFDFDLLCRTLRSFWSIAVPKCQASGQINLDRNDFLHEAVGLYCKLIEFIVKNLEICFDTHVKKIFLKDCFPEIAALYFMYVDHSCAWTNQQYSSTVTHSVKALLSCCGGSHDLSSYFQNAGKDCSSMVKATLLLVKKGLGDKNTMKNAAYAKVVQEISCVLSETTAAANISNILPLSLSCLDDCQDDVVMSGISCISTVLNLVPGAELQMYGWVSVVFEALCKKMHEKTRAVVDAALPLIFKCLKILDSTSVSANRSRAEQYSRYNRVMETLISKISMVSDDKLLKIYFTHLKTLMSAMNTAVLYHFNSLMQIFLHHISFDSVYLPQVLLSLNTFISLTWLHCKQYPAELYSALFKIMIRNELMSPSLQKDKNKVFIEEYVFDAFKLLARVNKDYTESLLSRFPDRAPYTKFKSRILISTNAT